MGCQGTMIGLCNCVSCSMSSCQDSACSPDGGQGGTKDWPPSKLHALFNLQFPLSWFSKESPPSPHTQLLLAAERKTNRHNIDAHIFISAHLSKTAQCNEQYQSLFSCFLKVSGSTWKAIKCSKSLAMDTYTLSTTTQTVALNYLHG